MSIFIISLAALDLAFHKQLFLSIAKILLVSPLFYNEIERYKLKEVGVWLFLAAALYCLGYPYLVQSTVLTVPVVLFGLLIQKQGTKKNKQQNDMSDYVLTDYYRHLFKQEAGANSLDAPHKTDLRQIKISKGVRALPQIFQKNIKLVFLPFYIASCHLGFGISLIYYAFKTHRSWLLDKDSLFISFCFILCVSLFIYMLKTGPAGYLAVFTAMLLFPLKEEHIGKA